MHKNKDGNLVNIDRGKHVSRNNETINIKICLKKKKNGQIPFGRGIPLYSSSGPNRGLRG